VGNMHANFQVSSPTGVGGEGGDRRHAIFWRDKKYAKK